VRLQHIAEEISFQFSMDDPASAISLADKKTQYHLTAFEHQLQDWQAHATMDMPKGAWRVTTLSCVCLPSSASADPFVHSYHSVQ
jgi:hypothetical protein